MPFPNYIGSHKRLWTREHVLATLKNAGNEIQGMLPCVDANYNEMKKDRLDWPPSRRILEYFGSMGRAWLAAGFSKKRVSLRNINWLPEEDNYLKEHAGEMTLNQMAKYLCRSYQSVRHRLNRELKIRARYNQGYVSASELAKLYGCSCHRIRRALAEGIITGKFDSIRNRWQIDLIDLTPEAKDLLKAPKDTHKTWPTDLGDYYKRYGLKRTMINGKLVRVPFEK
jgi:hypothetical protein